METILNTMETVVIEIGKAVIGLLGFIAMLFILLMVLIMVA